MSNRLTSHKMFNAAWTERDEAVLYDLLKRKIGDIRYELKECTSPFARAKLKAKRKEYQHLLSCVEKGTYNSDILAAEMASYKLAYANMGASGASSRKKTATGKYVDSYSEIDFDFDSYFRKTRYFGASLPIILLVITLLVSFIVMAAVFVPRNTTNTIDDGIQSALGKDMRFSTTAVVYYKISAENDFYVPNDGKWPRGTFQNPESAIGYGQIYVDGDGNIPDNVFLNKNLGMTSIDITAMDIVKSLFYTPIMEKTQIKTLENYIFRDDIISWYNRYFISGRSEELKLARDESGNYSSVTIANYFGTYGAILCFYIVIILCIIQLIVSIARLFSYTSRRIHFLPLLIMLFLALSIVAPVFADIQHTDSAGIQAAFKGFFTLSRKTFMASESVLNVNPVYLGLVGLLLISLFLPFMFRNKAFKKVTFVPKGNRPHTYTGNAYPTKPARPPQTVYNPALPRKQGVQQSRNGR